MIFFQRKIFSKNQKNLMKGGNLKFQNENPLTELNQQKQSLES